MTSRTIFLALVPFVILFACKKDQKGPQDMIEESTAVVQIEPVNDAMMETAIIYEANVRQYSPEGTFEAFTQDIPQLRELGVKIIWLMPVHPISMAKRKATGDLHVEDIESEEERKKYLGSYYAVADYRKINPDLGTLEDFRKLVATAHENDMYVIMDWVANHTGWDHPWITEHPEYYTKNEEGQITDPLNEEGESFGWTDVADLNYSNPDLREAMIADMMYWLQNENIDGFRCDVAATVPTDFWQDAIGRLRAEKELFMLAEAWEPELLEGNLFDACYGWDGHHRMNDLAKGEKGPKDWEAYITKRFETYAEDDILMNFITNHDENAWAGTVNERMGAAGEAMLAMSYAIPGIPLIYSGQEYGLDHRLKFFEKDSIPKERGAVWERLARLGRLKNTVKALGGGKDAASYETLQVDETSILAFRRVKDDSEAVFMVNISNEPVLFSAPLNTGLMDGMTGEPYVAPEDGSHQLGPWEYLLLVK